MLIMCRQQSERDELLQRLHLMIAKLKGDIGYEQHPRLNVCSFIALLDFSAPPHPDVLRCRLLSCVC